MNIKNKNQNQAYIYIYRERERESNDQITSINRYQVIQLVSLIFNNYKTKCQNFVY